MDQISPLIVHFNSDPLIIGHFYFLFSPNEMMDFKKYENIFYFIYKAFLVLKMFKVLYNALSLFFLLSAAAQEDD